VHIFSTAAVYNVLRDNEDNEGTAVRGSDEGSERIYLF